MILVEVENFLFPDHGDSEISCKNIAIDVAVFYLHVLVDIMGSCIRSLGDYPCSLSVILKPGGTQVSVFDGLGHVFRVPGEVSAVDVMGIGEVEAFYQVPICILSRSAFSGSEVKIS